jgi:hypothetical protein
MSEKSDCPPVGLRRLFCLWLSEVAARESFAYAGRTAVASTKRENGGIR